MMRDQLVVQERMDACLNSMSKELHQLHSQSQEDGAKMAAMSLQLQAVMSSVEEQSKVVERDLEEVNGCFDCHRGEINHVKEREKEARDLIVGTAHKAKLFKTRLDRMEDNTCKCGHTPSEVGEDVSLGDGAVLCLCQREQIYCSSSREFNPHPCACTFPPL